MVPAAFQNQFIEWSSIPIKECNEPLVCLNECGIACYPQYYNQGIPGALSKCYARKGVMEKLREAESRLPSGLRLLVWDAWRPVRVQEQLYWKRFNTVKESNSDLSDQEIHALTVKYVTYPSLDSSRPAFHFTGGAVDVTLTDAQGKVIPMGTDYDHFGEEARTDYFEKKLQGGLGLRPEEILFMENRRLLFDTMRAVGFTNYPEEWWHYDYGNQIWGALVGRDAIYGMITKII